MDAFGHCGFIQYHISTSKIGLHGRSFHHYRSLNIATVPYALCGHGKNSEVFHGRRYGCSPDGRCAQG